MRRPRTPAGLAALMVLLAVGAVRAAADDGASLPRPLTLGFALEQAAAAHPDLMLAEAARSAAAATRMAADAEDGLEVGVEAEARWVKPSPLITDDSPNDSRARLLVSKRLYDFGRTRAAEAAADAAVAGADLRYLDVRLQRRLEIMARYFDVLLADLEFAHANEAMAIAYVELERIQDRNELGQVSDVDLLAAESAYERLRRERYAAQAAQRTTRALLATAMNRPGELSADLVPPALEGMDRERPELEPLVSAALARNPRIRALRADLERARQRLAGARATDRPTLTGWVEAAEYAKDFGSRDPWVAALTLDIPLYTGGRGAAAAATARAALQAAGARHRRAELEVSRAVLETWQEIEVRRIEREETGVLRDYRDLYLDRSRALYELEVRTDLGDAMVRFSEARLRRAEADLALALAWARLAALTGDRHLDPMPEAGFPAIADHETIEALP